MHEECKCIFNFTTAQVVCITAMINHKFVLRTYTGEVLDVWGEIQCNIVFKGKKYYLPIVVANYDSGPTLLGIWFCHEWVARSCEEESSPVNRALFCGSPVLLFPKYIERGCSRSCTGSILVYLCHESNSSNMHVVAKDGRGNWEGSKIVHSLSKCKEFPSSVPLIPWKWPPPPFQRIHIDFCQRGTVYFLVLIDSHSKWIEVQHMTSITVGHTICDLERENHH